MSYQHAIAWLHKTFPTRQRTTALLRPELEDHVLSRHDYELATRFLPGPNMDWHLAYGAGTSAAAYGYGSRLARPRWHSWRLRFASVAAFFVGSAYGTFRHLLLYYRFANTLESPQGFITALNHVDERLGGSGQIGFVFRGLLAKKPEVESDIDPPSSTGIVPDKGRIRNQDSAGGLVSITVIHPSFTFSKDVLSSSGQVRTRTRWDEIRAVNSPSAGQSTWDTIRQRHERSRLPDSNLSPDDSPPLARAQFGVLPEAERRRDQFRGDPQ